MTGGERGEIELLMSEVGVRLKGGKGGGLDWIVELVWLEGGVFRGRKYTNYDARDSYNPFLSFFLGRQAPAAEGHALYGPPPRDR